jgi:hypothetical protein
LQNRLYHINDDFNYGSDDIHDMGVFDDSSADAVKTNNNYRYTELGELLSDNQEEIEEIIWRVDGKIKEIRRTESSTKKNLKFDYDPMGNRVAKHIYNSNDEWLNSTYYMRDAQGNVYLFTTRKWNIQGIPII